MKVITIYSLNTFCLALLLSLPVSRIAKAQYWGVQAVSTENTSLNAFFSNDDKRVMYLTTSAAGFSNIYAYDLKSAISLQITNATDASIVKFYQVPNKPLLIYMKATAANPTDYHLYKIISTPGGTPEDLTPTKEGVTNKMLGASYNGKYVYYSSNKSNLSKTDYYRYDIAQNISELVFANDKNYELLSWTKDQNLVLLKEPTTSKMFLSNVQTTERETFETPPSGMNILSAMWAPNGKQFYLLATVGAESHWYIANTTSATSISSERETHDGVINSLNPSIGGKFIFIKKDAVLHITDGTGNADILSSPDLLDAICNGKETMILLTVKTVDGKKLQIYDVAKKTTTDVVIVKQ